LLCADSKMMRRYIFSCLSLFSSRFKDSAFWCFPRCRYPSPESVFPFSADYMDPPPARRTPSFPPDFSPRRICQSRFSVGFFGTSSVHFFFLGIPSSPSPSVEGDPVDYPISLMIYELNFLSPSFLLRPLFLLSFYERRSLAVFSPAPSFLLRSMPNCALSWPTYLPPFGPSFLPSPESG